MGGNNNNSNSNRGQQKPQGGQGGVAPQNVQPPATPATTPATDAKTVLDEKVKALEAINPTLGAMVKAAVAGTPNMTPEALESLVSNISKALRISVDTLNAPKWEAFNLEYGGVDKDGKRVESDTAGLGVKLLMETAKKHGLSPNGRRFVIAIDDSGFPTYTVAVVGQAQDAGGRTGQAPPPALVPANKAKLVGLDGQATAYKSVSAMAETLGLATNGKMPEGVRHSNMMDVFTAPVDAATRQKSAKAFEIVKWEKGDEIIVKQVK